MNIQGNGVQPQGEIMPLKPKAAAKSLRQKRPRDGSTECPKDGKPPSPFMRASPKAVSSSLLKGPPPRRTSEQVAYLPIEFNSCRLLNKEPANMWRTTNIDLKAPAGGIAFRASKNMADKLSRARGPDWGDVFPGVDEGDGWVRTIVQVEEEADHEAPSASQHLKTNGLRRPLNLPSSSALPVAPSTLKIPRQPDVPPPAKAAPVVVMPPETFQDSEMSASRASASAGEVQAAQALPAVVYAPPVSKAGPVKNEVVPQAKAAVVVPPPAKSAGTGPDETLNVVRKDTSDYWKGRAGTRSTAFQGAQVSSLYSSHLHSWEAATARSGSKLNQNGTSQHEDNGHWDSWGAESIVNGDKKANFAKSASALPPQQPQQPQQSLKRPHSPDEKLTPQAVAAAAQPKNGVVVIPPLHGKNDLHLPTTEGFTAIQQTSEGDVPLPGSQPKAPTPVHSSANTETTAPERFAKAAGGPPDKRKKNEDDHMRDDTRSAELQKQLEMKSIAEGELQQQLEWKSIAEGQLRKQLEAQSAKEAELLKQFLELKNEQLHNSQHVLSMNSEHAKTKKKLEEAMQAVVVYENAAREEATKTRKAYDHMEIMKSEKTRNTEAARSEVKLRDLALSAWRTKHQEASEHGANEARTASELTASLLAKNDELNECRKFADSEQNCVENLQVSILLEEASKNAQAQCTESTQQEMIHDAIHKCEKLASDASERTVSEAALAAQYRDEFSAERRRGQELKAQRAKAAKDEASLRQSLANAEAEVLKQTRRAAQDKDGKESLLKHWRLQSLRKAQEDLYAEEESSARERRLAETTIDLCEARSKQATLQSEIQEWSHACKRTEQINRKLKSSETDLKGRCWHLEMIAMEYEEQAADASEQAVEIEARRRASAMQSGLVQLESELDAQRYITKRIEAESIGLRQSASEAMDSVAQLRNTVQGLVEADRVAEQQAAEQQGEDRLPAVARATRPAGAASASALLSVKRESDAYAAPADTERNDDSAISESDGSKESADLGSDADLGLGEDEEDGVSRDGYDEYLDEEKDDRPESPADIDDEDLPTFEDYQVKNDIKLEQLAKDDAKSEKEDDVDSVTTKLSEREGVQGTDGLAPDPSPDQSPPDNIKHVLCECTGKIDKESGIEHPGIAYEGPGLIILYKPPRWTCTTSSNERTPGTERVQDWVSDALSEKYSYLVTGDQAGLAHRLDCDTSGPLVLATDDTTMRSLRQDSGAGKWYKEYLALMHGQLPEEKWTGCVKYRIESIRDGGRFNRVRRNVSKGKHAETHYQALRVYRRNVENEVRWYTLLRVRILTGRTHQIRVHLAALGRHLRIPLRGLIGDNKYAHPRSLIREDKSLCNRIFLHEHILKLPPRGNVGEAACPIHVISPLPDDLKECLNQLTLDTRANTELNAFNKQFLKFLTLGADTQIPEPAPASEAHAPGRRDRRPQNCSSGLRVAMQAAKAASLSARNKIRARDRSSRDADQY